MTPPIRLFVVVGLAVAAVLALLVAPAASSQPDGLERVAADHGLDTGVRAHALEDGPLADYTVGGVDDARLGTALSGILGVAVTFAVGAGVLAAARAARARRVPTRLDATA